jgi:hypothetical protein
MLKTTNLKFKITNKLNGITVVVEDDEMMQLFGINQLFDTTLDDTFEVEHVR